LGAGLALAGVIVLILAISNWLGRSPGWAYDFHAYYDAALRLMAMGTPYQAQTLGGPFRPGPFGLYLYSPVPALLFVPLTSLGQQGAILVWLALRVGLLVATCLLMPVSRGLRLATLGIACLSAPVLFDLNLGNVSLIVTFCAVVTWRYLDRPIGSIALAASLMMRPTMALIGSWWLLRGLWRPIIWTAVAGVAILLATLPFVGVERWLEYLTVLRNVSNMTGVRANVDLGSSVLLMGGPAWLAQAALYVGYAVAAGAVLLSLRRDRELSFVVTLMATLLLSPLLWDHYLTHLLIAGTFLASRGRWWGLVLPLLCWSPPLLAVVFPGLKGIAEFVLAYIALAGLLLPLTAPDRGERAGTFLDRLAAWRAGQRTREPARA
jgi:hypothetical protein